MRSSLPIKFIRETQILKVKRIKIWKSNNPAKGGGFNIPQLAAEKVFKACFGVSYP
jgi:hypothetical protein